MLRTKEEKRLLEKSARFAAKTGFKLNSNKKIVERIIKGLISNKRKYGRYCCPCRISCTKRAVCPCYDFRKYGECICRLFVK